MVVQTEQNSDFAVEVARPRSSLRTEKVSRSLREVARLARDPTTILLGTGGTKPRWQRAFIWGSIISFIVLVFVPIATASIYLGLIASNQYVSETRFAVRGGERSILDASSSFGFLIGLPPTQLVQDSYILYDYIRGRGIVEDLDREINLRALFGKPEADYFSRFNARKPIEDLVRYWEWHVYVGYDVLSSTITVSVPAFSPQDALTISRKVIALSERLVNELSKRARRDALALARSTLKRAQNNLEAKIGALRDLRNNEGVLDASKTADVITKIIGDLKLELIHLEQEYDIQRRSISSSSPQLQVQKARINSMRDQIQRLETQMTNRGASPSLANAMSRFDQLQLERNIAEKQYTAAAATFEAARLRMEEQQVYLVTFLQPVLAQEALYPRRWWLWSIVVLGSLALWVAFVAIAVLVKNYIAV